MSAKWSRSALRISAASLSCLEITNRLGISASRCFDIGQPLNKSAPERAKRAQTLWILESGLSTDEPLEKHIEKLIEFVEERQDAFRILESDGCEFDLSCGFSSENGQGGFTLDHRLMRRIMAWPIDLMVDLYPPSDQELVTK